jgi:hypothetical protein
MNISDTVWSFLSGVLIIAILVVLARPGSGAAAAVNDVGGALTSLVKASVQ